MKVRPLSIGRGWQRGRMVGCEGEGASVLPLLVVGSGVGIVSVHKITKS